MARRAAIRAKANEANALKASSALVVAANGIVPINVLFIKWWQTSFLS